MPGNDLLVLTSHDVLSILMNREEELIDIVGRVYGAHEAGHSSLPHSTFLRFPDSEANRIIALPAYLGADFDQVGIKWVASFPENVRAGLDRASAVIILNSSLTGRPKAILDGSIISAKRTAASAALAARRLLNGRTMTRAAIIGCGLINFEVVRFLLVVCPDIVALTIFDLDIGRANAFKDKCETQLGDIDIRVAKDVNAALGSAPVVSLATTATTPHIFEPTTFSAGSIVLHLSLRDLAPAVILACDNVVDDIDHVCRAQTSIHLTEQLVKHREFIRCTLAQISDPATAPRGSENATTVFSPFGLGILDIAVASFVHELGDRQGGGTRIPSFLPDPWHRITANPDRPITST
jgi:ornithine cyclodeaminase